MSALESRGCIENASVLDAFAGSGALGLEALSRGAASAVFCDNSKATCRVIGKNIASLGVERDRYRLVTTDTLKNGFAYPKGLPCYSLVFLDPPYKTEPRGIFESIDAAISSALVSKDCIYVYEHDRAQDKGIAELLNEKGFASILRRTYGTTTIDVFYKPHRFTK